MTEPDPTAPRADTTEVPTRWMLNPTTGFAAAAAVLLAAGALVSAHPQLALLALPLFVVVALGADARPRRGGAVTTSTRLRADTDGLGVGYDIRFDFGDGDGDGRGGSGHGNGAAEAVAVRLAAADGTVHWFAVDTATASSLTGRIPVPHSGPQRITDIHYSLLGGAGTSITLPVHGPRSSRLIPAPRLRLDSLPLPHRVVGITGAHGSALPGEGGEFRDVSLFTPGDRLRRIDWKVTARRAQSPGDLYVRRSFATADAIVMIVVDDRDEVGADITKWGGARGAVSTVTSLDLGREAASSLSAAYLAAGDRVGLRDLAGTVRSVEPGGGSRHLDRLHTAIATAAPTGEPVRAVRTPIVPSSSLVVVVSTFLDEQAATMAVSWASTGHRVLAVDVLPEPIMKHASRDEQTAFRLLMLERTDRLDGMTASGVEPLRWAPRTGGTPPALQLRVMSRPRRAR